MCDIQLSFHATWSMDRVCSYAVPLLFINYVLHSTEWVGGGGGGGGGDTTILPMLNITLFFCMYYDTMRVIQKCLMIFHF